jgi:hypothetical protein
MDAHRSLPIGSRGEDLALSGWDRGIAFDQTSANTTKGLNTQ